MTLLERKTDTRRERKYAFELLSLAFLDEFATGPGGPLCVPRMDQAVQRG